MKTTRKVGTGSIGKKNMSTSKPFTPLTVLPPPVIKGFDSNAAHSENPISFQPPLPSGGQITIEESTMSPFMNPNSNVIMTEKKTDTSTLEFNNFLESLGTTNNTTSNTNNESDGNETKLL